MNQLKKLQEKVKPYLVDTLTPLVLYTIPSAAIELASGMNDSEVLCTRAKMAGLTFLTARPYGLFREYLVKKIGVTEESGRLKKAATEVFVSSLYWGPIYFATAYSSGASLKEIGISMALGTPLAWATARPMGIALDKVRNRFGLEGVLEKPKENEPVAELGG